MMTLTTSLRPHLEKRHLGLYMSLAKERGWEVKLPSILKQARSQASVAASEGERPDAFSEIAFHERLVKFIVINDQVCSLHQFNI